MSSAILKTDFVRYSRISGIHFEFVRPKTPDGLVLSSLAKLPEIRLRLRWDDFGLFPFSVISQISVIPVYDRRAIHPRPCRKPFWGALPKTALRRLCLCAAPGNGPLAAHRKLRARRTPLPSGHPVRPATGPLRKVRYRRPLFYRCAGLVLYRPLSRPAVLKTDRTGRTDLEDQLAVPIDHGRARHDDPHRAPDRAERNLRMVLLRALARCRDLAAALFICGR